jgi:hypothetical protein
MLALFGRVPAHRLGALGFRRPFAECNAVAEQGKNNQQQKQPNTCSHSEIVLKKASSAEFVGKFVRIQRDD